MNYTIHGVTLIFLRKVQYMGLKLSLGMHLVIRIQMYSLATLQLAVANIIVLCAAFLDIVIHAKVMLF